MLKKRHKISTNNKIDLYGHLVIKGGIFEAIVTFSPMGTPIVIINYYFEHYSTTYIYQSNNNIPWNRDLPKRQRTTVWIINIGRKYPTTVQHVIEAVSSQQLLVKCNKFYVITSHRNKSSLKTNLQEN